MMKNINNFCFVDLPTVSKTFQRLPTCLVYIDYRTPHVLIGFYPVSTDT